MNKNFFIRAALYVVGLAVMTIGIAISVKSNLGVSPVSSIPYTLTVVAGIEMGIATILFHVVLVCAQALLLRRAFKAKNLLQVPVGVLFGFLTTLSLWVVALFPNPDNMAEQIILMFLSAPLVAFGIFLYVPSNFIPLAGEGAMLAVSKVTKVKFSTVKIAFDFSMVAISLVVCLICVGNLGSVGVGTVVSALLVGVCLKAIS